VQAFAQRGLSPIILQPLKSGSQRAFPHNWTAEDLMAALKASLAAAEKRIA